MHCRYVPARSHDGRRCGHLSQRRLRHMRARFRRLAALAAATLFLAACVLR